MDPLEAIELARATRLADEDGNEVELTFAPPLRPAETERLADEAGVPLSRELRVLLEHTRGIEGGPLDTIDFTGRSLSVESEAFPTGLPIAGDGYGNFWIVDLTPDDLETAPVFFACHDPPVVLLQSPSIGDFLHETFRLLVPPHTSAVDDVHEDRLFDVWRENPGTLDQAAALGGDDSLSSFAGELGDRFTYVDLRSAPVGMGFSWGRHGPRTEVRRHGHERLFAYAAPEKRPGLFRRRAG